MCSIQQDRRFYLITSPRTTSNLLVKILALDDQLNDLHRPMGGGYFFFPTVQLINNLQIRGTHIDTWTEDQRAQVKSSLQKCFDDFEAYLKKAAAENKIAFVKEHLDLLIDPVRSTQFTFSDEDSVREDFLRVKVPSNYGSKLSWSLLNQTILPDQFLATWLPTFLIRHPALSFPSQYRAFGDLGVPIGEVQLKPTMTMHWTRAMYDWFSNQLKKSDSAPDADSTFPLIIDADDVIGSRAVITRYCNIVGLDPNKLKFSWAPANEADLSVFGHASANRMLDTLSASTGILQGKLSTGLEIDVEAEKWKVEFGVEHGMMIEKWVRDAMPDYEFMKERRLRAESATKDVGF